MLTRIKLWLVSPAGRLKARWVLVAFLMLAALGGFLLGEPFWDALSRDTTLATRPPAGLALLNREERPYLFLSNGRAVRRLNYDQISAYMIKSVLAREDCRYWDHHGVDPRSFARAFLVNLKHRQVKQGGSTITMQLVQHVYQREERGLVRALQAKVFEAILAIRIERWAAREFKNRRAGKEALLANYLNVVSFGHGTIGLAEAAHQQLNGKKPSDMTLGECAYFAGLLRAPSKNSAYINPENARLARDAIRKNLLKLEWITPQEAERMDFYVASRTPRTPPQPGDGYTRTLIRREISSMIDDGRLPARLVAMPGIEVVMTLDVDYQTQVHRILVEELQRIERSPGFRGRPGELDGAVVVFDHASGGALAVVGGRDFSRRQFNHAFQGRRPMASTIKPFVIASYLDVTRNGSGAMLSNFPLTPQLAAGLPGNHQPRETSRLTVGRPHRVIDGLAFSSNRMTLQAGAAIGWPVWQERARQLGIWRDDMTPSTDFWLGTCEVSPWKATAAFMALARGGSIVTPHLICEVRQRRDGELKRLWQVRPQSSVIFQPSSVSTVHEGLRGVLLKGTASSKGRTFASRMPAVAGKTGTSDDVSDAWFIGYTDSITVGVWIGFPAGRKAILHGADGATIAYPVFERVVKTAPRKFPYLTAF